MCRYTSRAWCQLLMWTNRHRARKLWGGRPRPRSSNESGPSAGRIVRPGGRARVRGPAPRNRGSALLAVLWLAAALAAIAFALSSTVRSETNRAGGSADGLRASYLASGSVERGIQWMLWGWTGHSETNPDGTPRYWAPNTPRMIMHYASGDAVVELIPESSKLNINTASSDELFRVVAIVSGDAVRARAIVEAIIDW